MHTGISVLGIWQLLARIHSLYQHQKPKNTHCQSHQAPNSQSPETPNIVPEKHALNLFVQYLERISGSRHPHQHEGHDGMAERSPKNEWERGIEKIENNIVNLMNQKILEVEDRLFREIRNGISHQEQETVKVLKNMFEELFEKQTASSGNDQFADEGINCRL